MKNHRKAVLIALAALTAGTLLAGCASQTPETTADPTAAIPVRIALVPTAATEIIQVGLDQGIFEQNGLDVTVSPASDLSTFVPALGKQYDVIGSSAGDFLSAAVQGFDIVATTGWNESTKLIAGTDIKSYADLDGKTIALPSLSGAQWAAVSTMLDKAGVTANLVAAPFSALLDQLKAGQVDAATIGEPFSTQALTDPKFHTVGVAIADVFGSVEPTVGWFSTSSAFLKEHPEAQERWLKSWNESVEWVKANDGEFRSMLVRDLKLSQDVADSITIASFQEEVSADALVQWADLFVSHDLTDPAAADLDFTKFVLG